MNNMHTLLRNEAGEAMQSTKNIGKPLGGRTSLGEFTVLPRPPSWRRWTLAALPPKLYLWFDVRSPGCGPTGLANPSTI